MQDTQPSVLPTRLAVCVSAKKAEKMNLPAFIDYANKSGRNVKAYMIDPAKSVEEQIKEHGGADIVLHKLTDEMAAEHNEDKAAMVANLDEYLQSHPEISDVEPIRFQRSVLSRSITSRILDEVESSMDSKYKIRMPKHVSIESEKDFERAKDLRFPLVCKTTAACGSAESHQMGIVFDTSALMAFPMPMIAQEFYNHDATVFKIFVIGEHVFIQKRKSLPNLPKNHKETIHFDSQQPFGPQLQKYFPHDEKTADEFLKNSVEPSLETVRALNHAITNHLHLSLYGFDMITEVETGNHAVVDINYFPTYKDVPDLYHNLLSHVLSRSRSTS
eukprot:TRINITY_DN5256_c0_g1_i1.p1 TRINITY_DN5256_c0_g1~~TRINITY_DN5256_c0_g1_i1.p1  ORF type:complete len:331 (+),score=82.72 TRINITY_DN5256_c0_g1_i1:1-993(+)